MKEHGEQKRVVVALPVLLVGGTEIQTLNLVRVLVSAGYLITICCYYEYDAEMVSRFEAAGVDVLLMKYERVAGLWPLAKGLIRLFKEKKPDIVHVQYVAPGFVPVVAARIAHAPIILATVHQPATTYGLKARLLLRTAAWLCNSFFCVSRSVEESWFGESEVLDPKSVKAGRKHFTIYNAVDFTGIEGITQSVDRDEIRRHLKIDQKQVIGVVGRLRWEKGQNILLHAMIEVIRKCPDTLLMVVGDGPDLEDLKKSAERLGIQNHIIWTGVKTPNEVWRLYSIMDVLAVPSLFEGFGLVAAEAMVAGVPIVASDVDGLREVVENGATGYLVPAKDDQTLAERLIQLLNNPAQAHAMGRNGRDRVIRLFSMERFSESMRFLYNHFLKTV
ncbi:glycosyltransferase family 4 protein [Thermodesulfobacteriota bacterium]